MAVSSQNLMQCFVVIHHDEITKFKWPRKMSLASLSDHTNF